MLSPEYIYIISLCKLRNLFHGYICIYVCTYICVPTINEKREEDIDETAKKDMGVFGVRKRKENTIILL